MNNMQSTYAYTLHVIQYPPGHPHHPHLITPHPKSCNLHTLLHPQSPLFITTPYYYGLKSIMGTWSMIGLKMVLFEKHAISKNYQLKMSLLKNCSALKINGHFRIIFFLQKMTIFWKKKQFYSKSKKRSVEKKLVWKYVRFWKICLVVKKNIESVLKQVQRLIAADSGGIK